MISGTDKATIGLKYLNNQRWTRCPVAGGKASGREA